MPKGVGDGWALDQTFPFPYIYGENFVYDLYRKGGWNRVNIAYQQVPSSSAQILDIDKYVGGFEPILLSNPKPVSS